MTKSKFVKRNGDGTPVCLNCEAVSWTERDSGLSDGLISCGSCGYLPKNGIVAKSDGHSTDACVAWARSIAHCPSFLIPPTDTTTMSYAHAQHHRESYWRINSLPIGGHVGPEETHTRGESYTLTTALTSESDSPESAWPDHIERYERLRQFQPYAGQFDTYEAIDGTWYFREQHGEDLSLLVDLRPPGDSRTGLGGFYLISQVSDATTLASAIAQLEFELLYIAGLGEYPDRQAVHAALEADAV